METKKLKELYALLDEFIQIGLPITQARAVLTTKSAVDYQLFLNTKQNGIQTQKQPKSKS